MDFFQAKQSTASADSISLYSKCTTLKMLQDKTECKAVQRKTCTSSRNIKTQQHLAGTPKQLPKKQNINCFGTTGKHFNSPLDRQTRCNLHKHKGTLKVQANKGFTYTLHHQRGANTKHSCTKRQHLCSGVVKSFWVNWNKSGKRQTMTFGGLSAHITQQHIDESKDHDTQWQQRKVVKNKALYHTANLKVEVYNKTNNTNTSWYKAITLTQIQI